jgi:hypothetical protein
MLNFKFATWMDRITKLPYLVEVDTCCQYQNFFEYQLSLLLEAQRVIHHAFWGNFLEFWRVYLN